MALLSLVWRQGGGMTCKMCGKTMTATITDRRIDQFYSAVLYECKCGHTGHHGRCQDEFLVAENNGDETAIYDFWPDEEAAV